MFAVITLRCQPFTPTMRMNGKRHFSLKALNAVVADSRVRVLVTLADFGIGKLNGAALARMLRIKRPGVNILFLALPSHQKHTGGLGTFLSMPLDPHFVVDVVEKQLAAD